MKKNKLAIFDFDGTISKIDSTKFFLKISFGKIYFFYGYYLRFIHLFILSKIGLYKFIKLKERRISFFLKGVTLKEFDQLTIEFNTKFFSDYLKPEAIKKLNWHKKNNHVIVILSATLNNLLSHWSSLNDYILIANNLSFKNNILTGNFQSPDCSYDEKLIRLKEIIDLNNFDYIYGYGDTESDKSFLNIVDKPYFRYFK